MKIKANILLSGASVFTKASYGFGKTGATRDRVAQTRGKLRLCRRFTERFALSKPRYGVAGICLMMLIMNALLGFSVAHAQEIYTLGAGDQLRITVYGEEDLSGEYEVDGTGSVALPLVGEVPVGGLTMRQAEQAVTRAYEGDYLLSPRVNMEVLNFRPFFILGEVNEPGNYAYINGMTVLNAVAVAKGYTYRASKSNISRKRTVKGQEVEEIVPESAKVFPGDVIHVHERFF